MMIEEDDMVDDGAFGTLTIGIEGEARFVGSFAGSEYLREEEDVDGGIISSTDEVLQTPIVLATPPPTARGDWTGSIRPPKAAYADSAMPPMPPGSRGSSQEIETLRKQLPDWELEGKALVESYWENVNWM